MNECKYFILNDFDRPYPRLVTQKIKDYYFYMDIELLEQYEGLKPRRPVSLEDFGFEIEELEHQVNFKKVKPSIVTYEDGQPREWDGWETFSLPKINPVILERIIRKMNGRLKKQKLSD